MNSSSAQSGFRSAWHRMKLRMTGNGSGRACLHLGCLLRGGNFAWHVAGLKRECQPVLRGILWVVAGVKLLAGTRRS